jgi:hypothetical protein
MHKIVTTTVQLSTLNADVINYTYVAQELLQDLSFKNIITPEVAFPKEFF